MKFNKIRVIIVGLDFSKKQPDRQKDLVREKKENT